MDPSADPGIPASPDLGRRLRDLRRRLGHDRDTLARALELAPAHYARIELGEARLPPICLPRLASLADAPLAAVLAELHGTDEAAAERHALVTAYAAIPTRMGREALLTMALSYSAGADSGVKA
jgi:transcriptional regulator with XRE-family HTH domain